MTRDEEQIEVQLRTASDPALTEHKPPNRRLPRVLASVAGSLAVLTLLAALAGCGTSAASPAPGIKVSGAVVPRPPSTDVGAAYFTVTNTSSKPDVFESASSNMSKQAEVHKTVTKSGAESMDPAGPITIGGGKKFVLSPGGYHLMLMGLTRSLSIGDHVEVTLQFKHAGTVKVEVPVVSPSALIPGGTTSGVMTTGSAVAP